MEEESMCDRHVTARARRLQLFSSIEADEPGWCIRTSHSFTMAGQRASVIVCTVASVLYDRTTTISCLSSVLCTGSGNLNGAVMQTVP
jgi:hypothetical protein